MIEHQRDIPIDSSDEAVETTKAHVRDYLAAAADSDDDPTTRAADVRVWTARHPERPDELLRIEGRIEADADAPYLKPDYDPWAGVDPALRQRVLGDG